MQDNLCQFFFFWQWLCPWLRCQPWSVPALSSRGRCGMPGWCHLAVEACTARWNYWERKEQKRKEDQRKGRVIEGGNDGLKRENKVGYRFKVKVNIPNGQSSSQNIPSMPCNEWVILWSLQPCHPLPKGKSGPFKIAKWKATICSAHVANFRVFKCSKLEGKSITLLKSILYSKRMSSFAIYQQNFSVHLQTTCGLCFNALTVQVPEPHLEILLRRCCFDPMSHFCRAKSWVALNANLHIKHMLYCK